MTGFVRKATLLSVCGLLAAATASASVPNASTSSGPGLGGAPAFINVVGTPAVGNTQAHPSTVGGSVVETYTIRDFAGNAVAGSIVEFNYAACTDMKLCSVAATNPGVSTTVQCSNIVRATTNALGQVNVAFLGAGKVVNPPNPGPAAGPGAGCIAVTADNIAMANVTAVDFDLNGNIAVPASNNGTNGGDQAVLKTDLGQIAATGSYRGRVDYSSRDGCGVATDCSVINGLDQSYFKDILGQSAAGTGSAQGCKNAGGTVSYCP